MMKTLIYASMGEFDDAERCSEQASDLAETNNRPYDIIVAHYSRGLMELLRGNLEEAEHALDQASRLSRDSEVRLFLPLLMCALGNLHVQRGQAVRARDILLQAKDEAEALGHETSAAGVGLSGFGIRSTGGCSARSHTRARLSGRCQAEGVWRHRGVGGLCRGLAFCPFKGRRRAEAIAQLERTIEIATRLGARPLLAMAKGILARLLAASGRKAEAQDELAQAIELFDKSKMTVQLERAKATLSKFSDL